MNDDIITYYAKRAKEYENIYKRPERKDDLKNIVKILKNTFKDKVVHEIACGTGYWTYYISETAKKVFASDINNQVIQIAKSKSYPNNNVVFRIEDLYKKQNYNCDSIFSGFIWSHIPKQNINSFLKIIHSKIKSGKIVFLDNMYVSGNSTPIKKEDEFGNSYQERFLSNGAKYTILKNFPSKDFLTEIISQNKGKNIKINLMKYYWLVSYEK